MLDINLFRVDKGGNPDIIKESQRKRGASVQIVDDIISLDKEWVELRFQVDKLNQSINTVQADITKCKKSNDEGPVSSLVQRKEELEREKMEKNERMTAKHLEVQKNLFKVGNIVHSTVVDSKNEDDNNLIRRWPLEEVPKKKTGILSHFQVLQRIDGYDAERGASVAGHRGYFLKNIGVRLNQALINYGLDFLSQRNYTLLQTPFMMRKEFMMKTAQLEDFDDQLYKISGNNIEENDDLYLIATSEQPISAFHANEWFENPSESLPIRYGGYSSCFRKEAGAHGKDTWGVFRVHQFEKIEQFVLTQPEQSWEMLEEMISTSEAFYQSLNISYRIVGIVSGALNNAASKKYDLEAWFPNFGQYKELVSCSNCTDYQSRRLEIRCGMKKMGDREKKYVHCLNSTLTATERTLSCILENYQTENGVVVPAVLRPYLGGLEFIPYTVNLKIPKN